ncbi:sensor histidine kinase [Massilia sp. LXY-6]|uniref:sensor histidine kinase n=1 Tax=Massilia sp. LXY-6 TaxID=3379823 RepID=UPI003EE167F4
MLIQRTTRFVNYATAISIVILVAATATLADSLGRTIESRRWVLHTQEVLVRLQGTISLVNEADALQKTLLIDDDPQDRADLAARLAEIPREWQTLRELTSDNPVQQRALVRYRSLLDSFSQALTAGLRRRPQEDHARMRTLRRAIQAQAATLRAEEERLLALRTVSVNRDLTRTIVATGAVAVLSIALLLFVRAMARQDAVLMRTEQARLRATLRSIGDAVIATDLHGRVQFMNPVAERLVGLDDAQAAGQPLESVLRIRTCAPNHIDLPAMLREVIASMKERARIEVSGSTSLQPDVVRDWILSCHPMMVNGKPAGAVIGALEVTELKQSQRHLSEANALLEHRIQERTERLAEANTELRAFARTVAHDLRAPLRNVEAYADALLEDEAPRLSRQGRGFLARIGDSARRMDRLITDLLNYSQLSRAELRLQPVDLGRVVRLALSDMENQLSRSRAQVELVPPLPMVLGNEALLVQVFENLIGNAIKFVPPGVTPTLRIHAREDGKVAHVWVSDNGIGIPPEQHDRIFGVFERLHGEEEYPGTGIGLAIVRKAMERLGGNVRVEPTAAGTSFRLCLPCSIIQEKV